MIRKNARSNRYLCRLDVPSRAAWPLPSRTQPTNLDRLALSDQISAKFWHLVNMLDLVVEQTS